MAVFPAAPAPITVGDLWGSGALKDVGPSGLIQLRPTKAAGWSWNQTWGLLSVRSFVHMELIAFLDRAWNRGEIFDVTHPLVPGSGTSPNGLGTSGVLVDGAAQLVGAISLITDGWPVSTQDVTRAGDVIKIAGDSAVYLVTARVSSNGAGGAEVPITPPLRKSPADDAAVTTTEVTFRAVLAERSQFEASRLPLYHEGYSVVFTEALA